MDNANVVGHVGRVLAGKKPSRPLEILVDGDLIAIVQKLLDIRGPGSTAISKVKGHADEGLVRGGMVREMDKIGNDMADQAADLGGVGLGWISRMLGRVLLMPVASGILLFVTCIGFLLP